MADDEEPLVRTQARGRRAGRREQSRRTSGARTAAVTSADLQAALCGRLPASRTEHPLSVTVTGAGRDVAMVGSHQVLQPAPSMETQRRHVRRSLFARDEQENVGAVYETNRGQIVGQLIVFGRPVTGNLSMGSRRMAAPPVNVTYLAPQDSVESVAAVSIQRSRTYVALMDAHHRTPAGTMWFDRSSVTWTAEMELSFQPGSVLQPGADRIRVIFERPSVERQY